MIQTITIPFGTYPQLQLDLVDEYNQKIEVTSASEVIVTRQEPADVLLDPERSLSMHRLYPDANGRVELSAPLARGRYAICVVRHGATFHVGNLLVLDPPWEPHTTFIFGKSLSHTPHIDEWLKEAFPSELANPLEAFRRAARPFIFETSSVLLDAIEEQASQLDVSVSYDLRRFLRHVQKKCAPKNSG